MEHFRFFPTLRRRLVLGLGFLLSLTAVLAQGTAFTYQGQLTDGPAAANGTYDLTFSLWNAASDGTQQGATLTQTAVGVTNGLFTATLDFGVQFNGASRWLEIAVRTNGAAAFTPLAERQPVLPTPYAIHAATAGSAATATTAATVTGNVPAAQLTGTLSAAQIPNLDASKITSGTFTGNGSGLTSLNASALTTGTVPVAQVPVLDADKVTTGTFATSRIPTLTTGHIPNLDASKITSGTFTGNGSGLTTLNASALSTGVVPAARIPDLSAGKITQGTLAAERIPGLDASKITSGVFSGFQIPGLDASWIIYGQFPDARLSANVALKNESPAFAPAAGVRAASFTGSRTGNFNSAVVQVENTETSNSASPTLRVLGRGGAIDGALSVSAESGRIARFGNSTDWVAVLDNDGKFSATSFVTLSDRNRKAGFEPVDVEAVLAKVASLPLTTWHYTNDAAATPHLGPMAQDFHAAFGLGENDKTITTVDADGVALAAIQGLHRRTETLTAENAAIREELSAQRSANAELRDELGEVRALVLQLQQLLNANRP